MWEGLNNEEIMFSVIFLNVSDPYRRNKNEIPGAFEAIRKCIVFVRHRRQEIDDLILMATFLV